MNLENNEEKSEKQKEVTKPKYSLEELIAQITDENKYEEIQFGEPQGKEEI